MSSFASANSNNRESRASRRDKENRLRARKKDDHLERDVNRSGTISHSSSGGPKRCTVDLSLTECDTISTAPFDSPTQKKSVARDVGRSAKEVRKRDSVLRDDVASEKSRTSCVGKPEYMTTQDMGDMLHQIDELLDRVSSFVSKSMPQVSFPETAAPSESMRGRHRDVLDRVHIMSKLLDFAESTMKYTKRGREVGVQADRSFDRQNSPSLRSARRIPLTGAGCERPRATARSFSAPRAWGAGLVPPNYPTLQSLRQNSFRALGSCSAGISAASVERKIRDWLDTIPIGNGASRGWDPDQMSELAEFAISKQLGDASAEHIYKTYVEFQVDEASRELRSK